MIDSVSHSAGAGASRKSARRQRAATSDIAADRLPPHSIEAESGVIGCILLSPSDCLDALDEQGMQPEWFYDLRHQHLFATCRSMHFRSPRVPVDVISVREELKHLGLLEQSGDIPYLNQLMDGVPSAANLAYYVEIVREKWKLRVVVQACTGAVASVYDHEGKVDSLLDDVLNQIGRIAELHTRRTELKIKQILQEKVIPKLEGHYTRGRAQMSGLVTTGLEYLDKIFCGLGGDNGNYNVVAARPNVGKTSIVTGMALHAALDFQYVEEVTEAQARAAGELGFTTADGKFMLKRKGVPVAISSLEMSADSIAQKIIFQRAQADLQRWRTGFATNDDFPPLIRAAEQICVVNNILIDDTARENIASIKAKWRRWHRQYGVRFFILDYIQLIKSTHTRFRQDRVQEMEEISAELQALGKELNCPMLILAQLNRDYEKEPNRLPRLSDLKNCGAIEQDADSVTLLYKPSPYKPFSREETDDHTFFKDCMLSKFGANWKKWDGRPERINALVEKNKHGPKGDAALLFLKSSTLFVDYTVWLKENGFKRPAQGEESRYKDKKEDDEQEDAP